MRYDDNGLAQLFSELEKKGVDFLLGARVQVAGGFIGKEDGGTVHKGAGNGHALLLPTGKLRRLVPQTRFQSYGRQQFPGPLPCIFAVFPANQRGDHHILQCGEFRQQMMCLEHKTHAPVPEGGKLFLSQVQDIGTVNPETALIRGEQGTQTLKESGFTGAGSTHDRDDFSLIGRKIYATKYLQRAERLANILGFNHHFHYLCARITKIGTILQKRNLLISLLVFLCVGLHAQELEHPRLSFARLMEEEGGFSPVAGNSLWSTQNGEEFLSRAIADIDAAQHSIEMEYYWFDTDKAGTLLQEALIRKAREGVRIQVVIDNLITPMAPEAFYEKIRKAGADIRYVHDFAKLCPGQSVASIFGFRDHRKILVIDGLIAYTGGMNFANEAAYMWMDTQIRVEGPVVEQFRLLFQQGWQLAGGAPVAPMQQAVAGSVIAQAIGTRSKQSLIEKMYLEVLAGAQEYIYIQTPYFAPPQSIVEALKACAARGVDVCILVPEECDWGFMNAVTRSYFEILPPAGIRMYYHGGIYDHSKIFISDDNLSCCGTVNMDYRSFRTNWENALIFYDRESALHFKRQFLSEVEESVPVTPETKAAKGLKKTVRNVLRKWSPIL